MAIGLFLLFFGVFISGLVYGEIKQKRFQWIAWLSVFGSAFLFAICFVHLLPEVYRWSNNRSASPVSMKMVGIAILIGFLLQLLLDKIGAGHEHMPHSPSETHLASKKSAILFLTGLSVHAFLEGMALIHDGHVERSMFYGVLVHNIPLSMMLMMYLSGTGYKKAETLCLLSVFGVAGPLGALSGTRFDLLQSHYHIVLAVVIGILLHVASSILYHPDTRHGGKYSFLYAVILAFVLVLLIPEHIHA